MTWPTRGENHGLLGPDRKYAVISVQWVYPRGKGYPSPPDGRYIVWSCCVPWPCAGYEDLVPAWARALPDYMVFLSFDRAKPRRRYSAEAKAKIRRQRLEARVQKKAPLFAEQLISEALAKKPDYFSPDGIREEDKKHAERMARLDEWEAMKFNPDYTGERPA